MFHNGGSDHGSPCLSAEEWSFSGVVMRNEADALRRKHLSLSLLWSPDSPLLSFASRP